MSRPTPRRATLAAFVVLLGLASAPLFSTVLPPLLDYPNHLARLRLLAEGGNAFYAVRWAPLPDLAADLVVPALAATGVPLAWAGKLFLVLGFALIAGGVVAVNRVATGNWRLWPMLGFLLLYNRNFLWGFVNYLFGLGVALCGVALWLALDERRWLRAVVSTPVALACFLGHLAAFGVYALVIAGVELVPVARLLRDRRLGAAAARITAAAVQFAIPAALLVWFQPQSAGGPVAFGAIWRKADLLFSVFDNYSRPFDAACFVLFAGLLAVLAWQRRLRLAPRLAMALAVLLAAYLVLPTRIFTGYGADHRLPTALFLLLIAAAEPTLPRRAARLVGITAIAMFLARMAVIEAVWLKSDPLYAADLVALDQLPREAKLAVAYPESEVNVGGIPQLHVATLAAARRDAFVPTLFAYPTQQPLALRPPYDALAAATSPTALWTAFVAGDPAARQEIAATLERYDFIVFASRRAFDVPQFPCLRPLPSPPNFRVFALRTGVPCF